MSEFRRRADDGRLDNIESVVMDLHAKINNGLSERSKNTNKKVDELHEQHIDFQQKFLEHTLREEEVIKQNSKAINELATLSESMVQTHDKWEGRLTYGIWTIGVGAVGIAIYVVYNANAFAEIFKPLIG